jgi:hypothetical protein
MMPIRTGSKDHLIGRDLAGQRRRVEPAAVGDVAAS